MRQKGQHLFVALALICQPSPSFAWSNAAFGARMSQVTSKQYQPKLHSNNYIYHDIHNRLWMSLDNDVSDKTVTETEEEPPSSTKLTLEKTASLLSAFWSMAYPYYRESSAGRRLFLGMILLTLMNSGVSVAFSYISKDFWNALSSKDVSEFYSMMVKFGGALVVGAPVAVLYR